MENAAKPNCASMKNMARSKTDMEASPVMQAMMKQCGDTIQKEKEAEHDKKKHAKDGESTGHKH
jgi:hypothetical protein